MKLKKKERAQVDKALHDVALSLDQAMAKYGARPAHDQDRFPLLRLFGF